MKLLAQLASAAALHRVARTDATDHSAVSDEATALRIDRREPCCAAVSPPAPPR